jgi:hypothetical protein
MGVVLKVGRILDVLVRLELYEIVGRRPSAVFLDETLKPTSRRNAAHRLAEYVFRRELARPGDQIHMASGQTLLLDSSQAYRAVQLSKPHRLALETAFAHAQRTREAEVELVEQLIRTGKLAEAKQRPFKVPQLRRVDQLFRADHPLVIEQRPETAVHDRL